MATMAKYVKYDEKRALEARKRARAIAKTLSPKAANVEFGGWDGGPVKKSKKK